MSSVNGFVFELGVGQGTVFTKSQHECPLDVQFILLYDMSFLALPPEIRRFDFFLYFCTEFVSYAVFQDCICLFHGA